MKLLITILLTFGLVLLPLPLSASDECAASGEAIPICTVLTDAAKYDGKEIIVKAIYTAAIHGSYITGAACSDVGINLKRTEHWHAEKRALNTIRSLTKKDPFHSVEIVVRGVFRKAYSGTCYGPNCMGYEFTESELFCASDVKPLPPVNAKQESER
jgi:hypothetical protein